jgi:hypothetical protein
LARPRLLSTTACALIVGIEDQSMQPKSQHWIWMTLAVLALAVISYLAMPPAVIKQATSLLSWG